MIIIIIIIIIMRPPIDSKGRMCYVAEVHVKHVVAKCTTLVPFEYTTKTQWTVCKHMVLQITDEFYKHTPERVLNINGTTIIWDRAILANQPDIVLHDNREKTCLMIDTAIPNDSNLNTKETEKLSKYKNLEIEVSRMWKVRTKLCQL